MRRLSTSQRGFSVIELLISMVIMLAVTGGIFSVMNPAQGTFKTQPEVADVQQRLRVGVDTLYKDILMVGAGSYAGTGEGTLAGYFASILPYRQGALAAIDDGELRWRTDGITLFYVPPTYAQTKLSDPMPNVSAELKVEPQGGCPPNDKMCGFDVGMTIILYDESGAYDTMEITEIQADSGGNKSAHIQHRQQGDLSKAYGSDARVAQIAQHVYYRDTTTNQLMHYDGSLNPPVPVVDNVVDLEFEYWGEPQPPTLVRTGLDPKTSYGPSPPQITVAQGAWPAGENCVIKVEGQAPNLTQVPRMPALGVPASGLVKLNDPAKAETSLTDGPWCPDAGNANRWDADLIRVRKVSVRLRVQSADAALRGTNTLLFRNPGTSSRSAQLIPDQEIRFDVTPRNLNLGR